MVPIQSAELPVERRRIGPAIVLCISALALVVLLVSGLGIGLLVGQQRVRAELAKIRAAGEPVTPADLEAFYSLPAGSHDTTALWLAAVEAISRAEYKADAKGLPLVGDADDKLPAANEPWPQQAEVEAFLTKYSDVLAKLHQAAALGGDARYPTRFSDGISMTLEPITGLRSAARLLTLEAAIHVRHGDARAAAESIHAILALAHSLDREPVLVALLVRIALGGIAINRLENLLAAADFEDGELAMFDGDLAAIDYYGHLHRSMLGARVLDLQAFDHPETLGEQAPHEAAWGLFRDADRAVYLQLMQEVVAASAAKDQGSLQAAMDQAHENIREAFNSPTAKLRYPITNRLCLSVDVYRDAIGKATAWRDVARAAVAIERMRRAKGRLPKVLNELVPEFAAKVPTDAFDGAPLRWLVTADDFRVYSVGPDGIDQGGTVVETNFGGDIVFRVPHRKPSLKSTAE